MEEVEKPINYLQARQRLKKVFHIEDGEIRKAEAKEFARYEKRKGLVREQNHVDDAEKHGGEEDIEHARHKLEQKAEPAMKNWQRTIEHRLEKRKIERQTAFRELKRSSHDRPRTGFGERRAA